MAVKKLTNILIVENEQRHADNICRMLEDHDNQFKLIVVTSLAESKKHIEKALPDLIIADINLPDGKGEELIPTKSQKKKYPIIIMLENRDPVIAEYLLKKGAMDCVVISERSFSHLPRVVSRVLSHWKSIYLLEKAEKTIVESERRFSSLVNNIPGAVYRCWNKLDRSIQLISKQIQNITGYSPEELRNNKLCSYDSLIHEKDRFNVKAKVSKAISLNIPYSLEYRILHKNGSIKWVMELGQGIFNDNGICLFLDGTIFDISDLKEGENKVRESEERLNLAIRATRDGIWDWPAPNSERMWWSKQSYTILGYENGEINPSISNFLNLIHRRDLKFVQQAINNHLTEAEPFDIEFRIKAKSGDYHWVRSRGEAVFNQNKQPLRMTGSIQNIHEQKAAEENIRKLSRAVEQSPTSIIITDRTGNIDYVNSSFTESTGYQKDEIIGKNPRFLKSGETPPEEYKILWETLTSGKNWHGVFHNKKKDGTLFWESAVISPIIDASGRVSHYLAIKENITRQKLIEEKLIESEKRFRSLVDQAVDAIYVHNDTGNFIHANRRTCESLGYTLDELLHLKVNDIETGFDLKSLNSIWNTITPDKTITLESVHKRKNGSTFPVEINIGKIIIDGSQRYLAFARDITSRKEAQAQLKATEAQMFTSEKLAGIGQLAAGVCHEVLNPVNIISVHTQMLQRKKKQDDELQVFCKKMRHEVDRIQKIMGTLLTFSRKSDSNLEKIQPVEIVDEVLTLVEQDFTLDNININREWSSEANSSYIMGDKDKLRQVFLNLINNSKYAMAEGGSLTVSNTLTHKNGKQILRLTLSDTGKGISDQIKERIFEPFFSTKPEGQGTGLGLSVVHRIIEDHGGSICVESEEKKGATFIIDFPLT